MVSRITVGSSHNVALATLYQVCLMPYGITLLCKDTNLPLVRFANVGFRLAQHSLPLWWQTNEFPWWFTPSLCFAKTKSSPLTHFAHKLRGSRYCCFATKPSFLVGLRLHLASEDEKLALGLLCKCGFSFGSTQFATLVANKRVSLMVHTITLLCKDGKLARNLLCSFEPSRP